MSAQRFGELVVRVATSNIGFGEVAANNVGPLLTAIGAPPGKEWCAYFASYCYRKAGALLAVELQEEIGLGWSKLKIGGAKRLGDHVKAKFPGAVAFKDPSLARPGDLVIWHRGVTSLPWGKGHVGIVERVDTDGILYTVEGNVGKFPAKVKRLSHDVTKERLFIIVGIRDGV